MDKNLTDNNPLISVVMSVYNGQTYLREAIDSVLNQTYFNFEFIIINDGSCDESLSIINSYQDSRIVLIDNGLNKGLIYSLNKGLEIAKGKYIARMDADDVCYKDRFEKQVLFLDSHLSVGVLGSNYLSFSESRSRKLKSIQHSAQIKTYLLFTATMCHPTLMIRKNILDSNHLKYSETAKYVEDFDLWTRLVLKTDFFNLNEYLLKYRDHQSQVSRSFASIQMQNSDIVREKYLRNLGFQFNQEELDTHHFISSNKMIISKNRLINIESWLSNLVLQNKSNNVIDLDEFNEVIFKLWLDCCGNTNLGLWSYFRFQKSNLKSLSKTQHTFQFKLIVKCLVRWLK